MLSATAPSSSVLVLVFTLILLPKSDFSESHGRGFGLAERPCGSDRRRLGWVAPLALILPVGGLSQAGALDHLEAEQGALDPGRRDVDPEQVENELLRQLKQL